MNIELSIERLVLEGLSAETAHSPQLRSALEAELTRLLTSAGLDPFLATGGLLPHQRGNDLRAPTDGSATGWGKSIAQAIYGGIHE